MKTFKNYISENTIEGRLLDVANLMAEKEVQPDTFLKTWFELNEPELAGYLDEAGVWDAVKTGAQTAWQGVKDGYQTFKNNAYGPQSKFTAAMNALGALKQAFDADPQLQQMKNTNPKNTGNLINMINGITTQLQQLGPAIPKPQYNPGTTTWQQPPATAPTP